MSPKPPPKPPAPKPPALTPAPQPNLTVLRSCSSVCFHRPLDSGQFFQIPISFRVLQGACGQVCSLLTLRIEARTRPDRTTYTAPKWKTQKMWLCATNKQLHRTNLLGLILTPNMLVNRFEKAVYPLLPRIRKAWCGNGNTT